MGIVAEPSGLSDIAAGRLDGETLKANFADLHPALSDPRGACRGRPLLFLFRRAVPDRLPDLDRHSAVHPRDRRRQSARRRGNDPVVQHHGRHVRARLPDRGALRGSLRARGGRGQAGAHRPVAALRGRRADGDGQAAIYARHADGQDASRSSAPGRPASPAPTRSASPATTSSIFEARPKAGGLNEYGIAAYKAPDAFAQAEVDFILSIGGIEIKYGKALGRDVTLDQLRKDYAAVFIGAGLPEPTSSGSTARARSPTSSTPSNISPTSGRRPI